MVYQEQYYYPYKDLCETEKQTIYTKDITNENINRHFYSIINILKDGIETPEVQSMMITVIFEDDVDVELSIFDYMYNLMFWQLRTSINKPITSLYLFFFEDITKKAIKSYIDNTFVDPYRKQIPFITTNQTIDAPMGKFRDLRQFQLYLANTLNLEDSLELMNKYPEFNDTVHFDVDNIPLEDVKDKGMEATNKQIEFIKNSDHCLRDSFRTGEAISPKQYKEVAVNIGSKPDGLGSVFPHPIKHSFMNGGLQTPEEITVESSVGRQAQNLQKNNVGQSGAFARLLELNNQDTFLHKDPSYICNSKNFEEVVIENETILKMFDLRYYRENPNGIERLLEARKDKHLIGKKLYFRSPMCCDSAAKGHGVCYRCYGDLAYANQEVNIGQIAAEGLSSIYTQILLSAKHLLESSIIKMEWNPEFYDMFKINFNTIGLKSDFVFRGYKLMIDEDVKSEEAIDEINYNYYINAFTIITPQGEKIRMHTLDADNIYFVPEFFDIYSARLDQILRDAEDNNIDNPDTTMIFDIVELMSLDALFIIEIKNNELSRTMDQIKKLIDNKTIISKYDRNSILEAFIKTNISGGISLNSVHFEILLMNQIRAADDMLDMPDWSLPNASYQILALSAALSNNRSITVALESSKVKNILLNPRNNKITKPSISDLYFMEQPQEYLDDDIISDEYKPESDIEENITEPISFENKKIRVGRKVKKRKPTKTERQNMF